VLGIRGSPPVAQSSACINLAALIVKTVTKFVANDCADGPIAVRRFRFRIKKWRLQDGRWKNDEVLRRDIEGVHCLRGDPPIEWAPSSPVDGPPQRSALKSPIECHAALHVAVKVRAIDR
jgi:hypothetical protein